MATASAITFDGNNPLRISAIANPSAAAGKLTLEAWVRPDSSERRPVIAVGAGGGLSIQLAAGGGNVAAVLWQGSTAYVVLEAGGGAVKQGQWSHVALTVSLDAGVATLTVFHQGKQVGTK